MQADGEDPSVAGPRLSDDVFGAGRAPRVCSVGEKDDRSRRDLRLSEHRERELGRIVDVCAVDEGRRFCERGVDLLRVGGEGQHGLRGRVESHDRDLLVRAPLGGECLCRGECSPDGLAVHAVARVDGEHDAEAPFFGEAGRRDRDVLHQRPVLPHPHVARPEVCILGQADDVGPVREHCSAHRRQCRLRRLGGSSGGEGDGARHHCDYGRSLHRSATLARSPSLGRPSLKRLLGSWMPRFSNL